MPKILITRPEPAATRLSEALQKAGYETIIEPLLTIIPTHSSAPKLTQVQAVIITSQNALPILEQWRPQIANILDLPCFCVGPRTAEAASLFGFSRVVSSNSDELELAHKIIGHTPSKINLLHITGEDVAGEGLNLLKQSDYKILTWPVYKAVASKNLAQKTKDALIKDEIAAVLLFSPRTAGIFIQLISQIALEACCRSVTAIGLSQAVADALQTLSWQRIVVAQSPSEASVIASLNTCYPAERGKHD